MAKNHRSVAPRSLLLCQLAPLTTQMSAGPSSSNAREAARIAGAGCVSEVTDGIRTTTETIKMCVPRPPPTRACRPPTHAHHHPRPRGRRRLLDQASQIHTDRTELGEAVTRKLLERCVENTRSLLKVEAQQKGHKRSLEKLGGELPEGVRPEELQRHFSESLKRHASASSTDSFEERPEMARLRALLEGRDDEAEEGGGDEDDVVMTQQTNANTKCPILQVEMTSGGELRPVMPRPDSGHTAACCFSFKGITHELKKARNGMMQCPQTGCNAQISKSQLVDSKDMVRRIREKEQEEEEE